MSTESLGVPPDVQRYLLARSGEHPVLKQLREATRELEQARMQIAPEQGAFLAWLVKLLGAQRTLEVGVFTGYSSLSVALALPPEGRLIACDVSEEWTRIARRHWDEARVSHKIELRLQPALQSLDDLLGEEHAGTFDFAFIDADKESYDGYYERCLELVRSGGVIAVDNTLWGGSVANPNDERDTTRAIRALNDKVLSDARVSATLVTIGDGLLLARKL